MTRRKETLGERLRREAREYLADLRELRDDLKSAEGVIALALVIVATLIAVAWGIVSLGFSPPNDHVTAWIHRLGMRPCAPISNFSGVIIIVDMFLVLFLTVVTLGNAARMAARVRDGLPREPRELIISAALMIVCGLGGILYMLAIC